MTKPIRKKRCPYCGKKLQAPNKRKFQNNLSRHVENCAPFNLKMLEVMPRMIEIAFSLLGLELRIPAKTSEELAGQQRDLEELKKLYEKE